MKIGVAREKRPYEARVAASPDTVKKYVAMGFEVAIETGAGVSAAFTDAALSPQVRRSSNQQKMRLAMRISC